MIVAKQLGSQRLATAICLATDIVGDLLYINGNITGADYQTEKADPVNNKMPAIAVIIYKITATRCVIQLEGNVNGIYTGLAAGKTYYVDATGRPSLVPPAAPVNGKAYVQPIGVAVDAGVLRFGPSRQMTILRNP